MMSGQHGDRSQDEHHENGVTARVAAVSERVVAPPDCRRRSWAMDKVTDPSEAGACPGHTQEDGRVATPTPPHRGDDRHEHQRCRDIGENRIDEVSE